VREEKRGVRLTFTKKRISEIDFIGGPPRASVPPSSATSS